MQLLSLLGAATSVMILPTGYQIGLDWLGHFARIIIEGVGIVGLGIIVFNLVLKAITLPFDIYQRVMSRKQNLIMQQMQPELEKLQKQYANDKQMYSQKMLELQKKSGYSMLGACLPLIVSFVIIIVAWQGFRAYSQYANLNYFEHMSESYNAAVLANSVDVGMEDFHMEEKDGKFDFFRTVNEVEERYTLDWNVGGTLPVDGDVLYTMEEVNNEKYLTVMSKDESKYIYYRYNLMTTEISRNFYLDHGRFAAVMKGLTPTEGEEVKNAAISAAQSYDPENKSTENALSAAAKDYLREIGSTAAAERFREDDPSFLWIKNVWYPDVSYNHPIPDYTGFKNTFGTGVTVTMPDGEKVDAQSLLTEDKYEALTYALGEEKAAPNGYFILIVLSIGFMLLSQIIAMKSNKTANQYQTVDGQGATTQKIMLVVMPLIYAIFAFQYSAAFSIYMTMSSVVTIIVSLLTNLILGKIFKKKEEKAFVEEQTRKLPWMK